MYRLARHPPDRLPCLLLTGGSDLIRQGFIKTKPPRHCESLVAVIAFRPCVQVGLCHQFRSTVSLPASVPTVCSTSLGFERLASLPLSRVPLMRIMLYLALNSYPLLMDPPQTGSFVKSPSEAMALAPAWPDLCTLPGRRGDLGRI